MNKNISIVLVIAGIMLIAFGVAAMESFGSDVSRFFTGAPTDKSIWLTIGGVIAAVVGLCGLRLGPKQV